MRKGELCDFGKAVKIALLDKGQTQNWLADAVRQDTGQYIDSAYLSRILTGERHPESLIASIRRILELPDVTKYSI